MARWPRSCTPDCVTERQRHTAAHSSDSPAECPEAASGTPLGRRFLLLLNMFDLLGEAFAVARGVG